MPALMQRKPVYLTKVGPENGTGSIMPQNGLISDSISVKYLTTNGLLFLGEQFGEKFEGIIRELDEATAEVLRVVDT